LVLRLRVGQSRSAGTVGVAAAYRAARKLRQCCNPLPLLLLVLLPLLLLLPLQGNEEAQAMFVTTAGLDMLLPAGQWHR
jgi:hypothetical protein